MRFLASIDVKNGECVRLCRGQMADCRVYASSPLEAVRKFNLQCCDLVHIVDLDGAVCGSPQNWRSILEAARQLKSCVQVGGGVRTLADAKLYLEGGASKVVLGTSAIADMEFVCRVSWLYPGRVCVGVDTLGELVATDGWTAVSCVRCDQLVRKLEAARVSCLIWTDINRDGTLQGVNFDALDRVLAASAVPVIVSGGVATALDLIKLHNLYADKLAGVICGKALYERTLTARFAHSILSV